MTEASGAAVVRFRAPGGAIIGHGVLVDDEHVVTRLRDFASVEGRTAFVAATTARREACKECAREKTHLKELCDHGRRIGRIARELLKKAPPSARECERDDRRRSERANRAR